MLVHQLRYEFVSFYALPEHSETSNQHHRSGKGRERRQPAPTNFFGLRGADHLPFEFRRRNKSLTSQSRMALQTLTRHRLCGTRRARAHVRLEVSHLVRREFQVHKGIDLVLPGFAIHDCILNPSSANIPRINFRAREMRDITVPTGTPTSVAISWYFISSTSHSSRTSR